MDKMIKRKKDEGFTLIELMIVIAVIGILAIVLVPKVGSIKTQAKGAGLDTNIRVVEGYVHSKIDKWVNKKTDDTEVQDDIVNAFKTGDARLTNPFTSVQAPATEGTAGSSTIANVPLYVVVDGVIDGDITEGVRGPLTNTNTKGTVVVSINGDAPIKNVTIYAYGSEGELIPEKTVTVSP